MALLTWIRHFRGPKRSRVHEYLFKILRKHVSLRNLVDILRLHCNTEIAGQLQTATSGIFVIHLKKTELPNSQFLHKFYQTLKSCFDSGVFNDREIRLNSFINTWKSDAVEATEPSRRQYFADKLACTAWLAMQLYTDSDSRNRVLRDMLQLPRDVNSTTANILFHSKMALKCTIAGEIDRALAHQDIAQQLCLQHHTSFSSTAMYHDFEYMHRRHFDVTGSARSREEVIRYGELGLQTLDGQPDCVRQLWTRIYGLYIVMVLLWIKHDFSMMKEASQIEEKFLKKANFYLKIIRSNLEQVEQRREMIYNLCMGRANESVDLHVAIDYVTAAVNCASDGGALRDVEEANISKYLHKLRSQAHSVRGELAST